MIFKATVSGIPVIWQSIQIAEDDDSDTVWIQAEGTSTFSGLGVKTVVLGSIPRGHILNTLYLMRDEVPFRR